MIDQSQRSILSHDAHYTMLSTHVAHKMEGGRGRICVYGRGGVCVHWGREGVYMHMEGVECVCVHGEREDVCNGRCRVCAHGEREDVCIRKGSSVRAWRGRVCIRKGWSVRARGEGGCAYMEGV